MLKITAAEQQTLAQASREIRQRLAAERAVAAEKAFETALRRKWKARTICRTGFVINLCAGTPEPGEHAASRYETQQRATGWHTAPLAAG